MNKKLPLILLCCSCLFMGTLNACSSGNNEVSEPGISLNVTEKKMVFGDKTQLIAIFDIVEGQQVRWASENERIAIVNDGEVEAVGIGTTRVSCTYNGETAYCTIIVEFDETVPSLYLSNISGDELTLSLGDVFDIDGKVFYNNRYYECNLTYDVVDSSVIRVSDSGQISALKKGTTELTISTVWKNYESSLLTKTLTVNVIEGVSLYAYVTLEGKTIITNEFSLSVVPSFNGKKYANTAYIDPFCQVGGVNADVEIVPENNNVITYNPETGVVTAQHVGTSNIALIYHGTDHDVTSNLKINVYSPVAEYTGETLEFAASENFPVAEYFGEGAEILSASQNGNELTIKRGKLIQGIVCKGADTAPITITTDKGSYVFTDLFVYDLALTKENIVDTLTLLPGKMITQYYVLNEDISGIDMTVQQSSAYTAGSTTNKYFAGTLDGRGHSLSAKVGREGIFGGFGHGAVVKNIHLHFDFAKPGDGLFSCGLARNVATYAQSSFEVVLQNMYVTASNFVERCYTFYDMKINNTKIIDVYVDLTGSGIEKLPAYEGAENGQAVLYRIDSILMNGSHDSFTGGIRNTYIVTGTSSFMPLGCGEVQKGRLYVTYAKNDAADTYGPNYLGKSKRHQASSVNTNYCIAIYDPDGGDDNRKYFGDLDGNVNGGNAVAWIYDGQSNKAEWGVFRFNSNSDLKTYTGISKVGDWKVNN